LKIESKLATGAMIMKMTSCAIAALAALASTGASAQSINLSGMYRCVVDCRPGFEGAPAYVTQNGENLNLVNEAGEPARAWPDWSAPASRIWVDAWDQGAVYSPDAMTIQFDNGKLWRRDLGPPQPLPPPPRFYR
jgi:hypothetical protein